MKRKIYWNMCLVALFSMVASTLLATVLLCQDMQAQMKKSVMAEARYLETAMEVSGDKFLEGLSGRGDGNRVKRITWIAADGSVLYDSYADNESLENHSQRPEVRQALETGRGQSIRGSDTLAEQTYYYASRLSDGTVIRIASTMKSGVAAVFQTIPWMLVLAAVIFATTMALAEIQTRRIVDPVNRLDPDNPRGGMVYDELSPLVRRLEKQRATIQEQMRILREKQEEFTAITENMQEGFIVVDSNADVISYNSSAIRILGVDMEEQSGEGNVNVLSFNRSGSFRQALDTALQGQRGEQELELNGRRYQIIANPVVEGANTRGAVVVILDVTEQRLRENLRREFTANVSHELKTPLTSISGYAEIMKDGLVQPADMGRFSEKIYQEAQRLITLVGDIIKLSRLDEGDGGVEKTEVDLCAVASGVVNHLRDTADQAKVSLMLKGVPVKIQGTERILDEMIFNLCDNAIKYNRPDGYVIITVEKKEGYPRVIVEDNGIGIPEGAKDRIFERFYRVDKSRSRQIGGTGLGLSIVKHGAIYHQAKVEIESTLEKGTRVTLTFPADQASRSCVMR